MQTVVAVLLEVVAFDLQGRSALCLQGNKQGLAGGFVVVIHTRIKGGIVRVQTPFHFKNGALFDTQVGGDGLSFVLAQPA